MLYRLLRSDPKTYSGNPSELVICIEPEPLQSKMELLPTNFLLHIQHFLSPGLLSRFVFQHERNDSYLQFFFLKEISLPIMISISCLQFCRASLRYTMLIIVL